MSEVSKIYDQFADSLRVAQEEHTNSLRRHAKYIKKIYPSMLKPHMYSYASEFAQQVRRLELRSLAERFFGSSSIPFVAIDGSCAREVHSEYLMFYGGAYGSRGTVSLSSSGGTLEYKRWEFNKDVSMVAFVPIPPEGAGGAVDQPEGAEFPHVASDEEISQISSIHTKIMQLAEVYLAYSLASSSTLDPPKILLLDGTLSGMLGNTSFSPRWLQICDGDFEGVRLSQSDAFVALAHPLSEDLQVPSWKNFQPHNRVIAEATWRKKKTINFTDFEGEPKTSVLRTGATYLQRMGVGALDGQKFVFNEDPRISWRRCVEVAERVCNDLLKEKKSSGITYMRTDGSGIREYFSVKDIQFITGVMLRALIEKCWERRVLLVGVAKDSNSRYFLRNFIGTIEVMERGTPSSILNVHISDRTLVELIPNISREIEAPWGTIEFDSCFMTIRPRPSEDGKSWVIGGAPHPTMMETTRPERIFLRSLGQFLLKHERTLASHALLIDRLAYPGWDDKDSAELVVHTQFFNDIHPLYFVEKPPEMQRLMMYLLSVLVRNHFPEALGYPDPLHKADWGAKSMRRRADTLLASCDWAERSNPRSKTFRQIRDEFRR
jgi:hypothetical protein